MVEGSIPGSTDTSLTQSLAKSLDSIEAALGRIEAAALARPAPFPAASDDDLQQRHAALQSAVGQALSRLDTLIEDQPIEDRPIEDRP